MCRLKINHVTEKTEHVFILGWTVWFQTLTLQVMKMKRGRDFINSLIGCRKFSQGTIFRQLPTPSGQIITLLLVQVYIPLPGIAKLLLQQLCIL